MRWHKYKRIRGVVVQERASDVSGHRTARVLVYTHRWLGIAAGLLFIVWFLSGIVMMYARMPALDPIERLARLPALDPAFDSRLSAGRRMATLSAALAGLA